MEVVYSIQKSKQIMNILDINTWYKQYGLLPVHLTNQDINDKYLMLDGGIGDFCLDVSTYDSPIDPNLYNSDSWSANTKNFVVVDNNNVTIHNWLKSSPEVIAINNVVSNIDKFYSYLLTKSYRTENDIVPFIIEIFRQLRNVTQESKSPSIALNLLYRLLISLQEDHSTIDNNQWGIDNVVIPSQFDFFVDKIRSGVNSKTPNMDIILRHTAGVLFQEAHRDALYFNPQRDLFGGVYSSLITKNELYTSAHYTPQYIARTIVEQSIKKIDLTSPSLKILDPACGSSEFLMEALKQLKNKDYRGQVTIHGWDISDIAISTSRFLLQYEKNTIWKDKLNFDIRMVDDSLKMPWDSDYDLILMNPPFVSWELLDKNSKESVTETLREMNLPRNKPNQASAFFHKAAKSLNENGILGCVLPTSLFVDDNYSSLRTNIYENLTLSLIAKLGNFVFDGALTDVGLFIGHRPKDILITPQLVWCNNEKGVVNFALRDLRKMTANNSETSTINEKKYSIYTPSQFPILQNNWKVISYDESKLVIDLEILLKEQRLVELKNIFTVKQGIRSGGNSIFEISTSDYQDIPDKEKYLYRRSVNNDTIKNGKLHLINYIWYPYGSNGLIFENEEVLQQKAPVSFEKLNKHIDILASRKSINADKWWTLSRHRRWLETTEPRLYSTEHGNSNSFAYDKEGGFVVERGYAWIPKKKFDTDDYYFYLAFFSSNLFDKLISIYNKQLSGGNSYALSAKYSNKIPIPDVQKCRSSVVYFELSNLGRLIMEDGSNFYKSKIDNILTSCFYIGLND